jgi:alpha-glucosidase
MVGKQKELIIQQYKSGKYITEYSHFKLNFHGLPFEITSIQVDNESISVDKVKVNGEKSLVITKDFTELHISGE